MTDTIYRTVESLCKRDVFQIDPKKNSKDEFWYVDISAIDNKLKKITSPQKVKSKNASVRAKQLIRKNDVLVATTRPNLNAVALVTDEYDGEICSTGFCVLRPNNDLNPDFLFYFVLSSAFVAPLVDLTKGALYPAVTDKQVFSQSIPWVPISEQRSIAACLKSQMEEVETARKAVQVQLQDVALLRQRLLRQAFDVLKDGPHKVLGEWAQTTSGSTPSRGDKRYWSSAEIPWVKTGEVAFAPITQTEEAISKQALAECSLALLPPQTVLIAMYGQGKTRGQSAILEIEATTNQACFAILPNNTWDPDFLHHWLMASYEDLRSLSDGRGGNQANLNGGLLNALEIPAPDLEDQRRLVFRLKQQLDEADALRIALEDQQRDLDALPQRILAQAFEN